MKTPPSTQEAEKMMVTCDWEMLCLKAIMHIKVVITAAKQHQTTTLATNIWRSSFAIGIALSASRRPLYCMRQAGAILRNSSRDTAAPSN